MQAIRGSFRSLLALGLLAVGLVASGVPAVAAGFEGTYTIAPKTLTVQVGVAATGRNATRSFRRSITLVKERLPAGVFEAEKAFWRTKIASWDFLSSRQKQEATLAMERHYNDLQAQINRYLRGFPDQVTVRGTGPSSAGFVFEDKDFGKKQSAMVLYNSQQGTFTMFRLPLFRGELGSKGLMLRFGSWGFQGSLPGRTATWATNASLLGSIPNVGAIAASLNLQGQVGLGAGRGQVRRGWGEKKRGRPEDGGSSPLSGLKRGCVASLLSSCRSPVFFDTPSQLF